MFHVPLFRAQLSDFISCVLPLPPSKNKPHQDIFHLTVKLLEIMNVDQQSFDIWAWYL